jgi:integrase/recombinase XerD
VTRLGIPLAEGVEEFLTSLRVESGLSTNTIAAYRRDLGQYLGFLAGREPSPAEVDGFAALMRRRGLADSTHRRKLAAIRGLHRFLVSEGFRDTDPTTLVRGPRRLAPFPKALDVDEAIALVEAPDRATAAGRRDAALLEFLYGTGARVSETVDLDLTDLDLEDRVALVTGKGSRQRLVPLGSKAVEALMGWLPDRMSLVKRSTGGDPVFVNLRGGRMTRQAMFDIVRKHASKVGIDPKRVSPHVLRHSAATHMVEAGADLRTVQEILGHATISTTQVYTRVTSAHVMEIYVQAHPRSR